MDDGCLGVDAVSQLLCSVGVRDIDRHNEHRDAAARNRGLARHDSEPVRLIRRMDHCAKNAGALEYRLEVHFLDKLEADLAAYNLTRDQNHGGPRAVGFVGTVDEVEAGGARTPAPGRPSPRAPRAGRAQNLYRSSRFFVQMN